MQQNTKLVVIADTFEKNYKIKFIAAFSVGEPMIDIFGGAPQDRYS